MLARSYTGTRIREPRGLAPKRAIVKEPKIAKAPPRTRVHPNRTPFQTPKGSPPDTVDRQKPWPNKVQKTTWGSLSYELKLHILEMCDYDDEVHAMGNADPRLIPYIVAAPALQRQQQAYHKAINGKRGPALIEALRQHLPAFWASKTSWLHLDSNESMEVIQEVCRLRNGRGPEPIIDFDQEACGERLVGLPSDVHLDVDVSDGLFLRGQAPWTAPPQAACLIMGTDDGSRGIVRGRHAFTASHALERIYISDLDLTRGRLDLSQIAECGFIELWGCTIGRGPFGLRWPKAVSSLRIIHCTFTDQTGSFDLPDGLEHLDLSSSPIASAASDYRLPPSLRTIHLRQSPISQRLLPTLLPPTLQQLSCYTEGFAPHLRTLDLPQTLVSIAIEDLNRPMVQPRRLKLAKRNWTQQLRAQHPDAQISIR